MEEPKKKRRRRPFWFWVSVVLVIFGVLYPLSIGPAFWIATRSNYREAGRWVFGGTHLPVARALPEWPYWIRGPTLVFIRFGAAEDIYPEFMSNRLCVVYHSGGVPHSGSVVEVLYDGGG